MAFAGYDVEDDSLHEECGVFGIWDVPDAAVVTALGSPPRAAARAAARTMTTGERRPPPGAPRTVQRVPMQVPVHMLRS